MEAIAAKRPHTSPMLATLLEDPAFPDLVEQATRALEEEKKRRQEFYDWLTDDVKAEFINGEIVVHSPVKRRHLEASKNFTRLATTHVDSKKLGATATEKGLVKLTRNDYEPDFCFWKKENAAPFDDDTMFHPAPDLAVEIWSKGTKHRDKGVKFKDYARHGVKEYWMVDPKKQAVEQYRLDDASGEYALVKKLGIEDHIESFTMTGFRIPVRALFDDEASLQALAELLK